ncbi:MAG: BatD family protein, partial [Limisphaerales bacterium]
MSRSRIHSWFPLGLFIPALLVTSLAAQGAITATAQLDRATIMTGETAALTVVVEGGAPQSAEPLPPIAGLTVQYRGISQNITSINGRTSIKHLLNYTVSARQPGQFTIPSITLTVDGSQYATQPVKITVTKADPVTQNRYAFLRLNLPKTEVYVGEVIPIELQLYVVDAENLQAPQLKSDGFVVHKQLENTGSQAQIGNILYSVLTFRMSISAAKAGNLTLGPAEMNLVLRLRAQPDPNDVFGFFGRFQRRPVTVQSTPAEINVLPLPTPVPPDFSGAIGSFNWTVTAAPTNLNAGDPITLRAVISGRGNLDNLKLPELNWPDFRTYQPISSVASSDPLGIEGSKTFEQVLVPQSGTVREIPAFSLAFFDPSKKAYLKLEHAATPLQIQGNLQSTAPAMAAENAPEPPIPRSDIVHIKTDPGQLATLAPPLIRQPWFLFLQAIPLAGVIGLTVWRKRQERLARN